MLIVIVINAIHANRTYDTMEKNKHDELDYVE